MNIGFHHHRKNRVHGKRSSQWDKLIYVGAVLGPFAILPQIIKIWSEQDAAGVSIITWGGYLCGAFFWGIYGFVHKEKPIVVANLITGFFVTLVLAGIMLYS